MALAHSILITSGDQDGPLSAPVAENIESFRRHHPGVPHRLHRGAALRAFIAERFGREVVAAYDAVKPYAYKADLGRFCLLYDQGGYYFDISIHFIEALPVLEGRITLFRDLHHGTPYSCVNGLIYSPPGHRLFEHAIARCVANIQNEYYGQTPLFPTGPELFGRSVAIATEPEDLHCGEAVLLSPGRAHDCFCFIHPGAAHGLVALRRKRAQGLSEIGIAGGNSYPAMWLSRSVYGFEETRSYDAAFLLARGWAPKACVSDGAIVIPDDHGDIAVESPGFSFEPGTYRLALEASMEGGALALELASEDLGVVASALYDGGDGPRHVCAFLEASIGAARDDFTLRLRKRGGGATTVMGLHVRKIG